MVERGYPENGIRPKEIPPIIVPEIAPVVEPKEIVKYVYYPSERIRLDPNMALIVLGAITVVGIIALISLSRKNGSF